MTTYTSIHTSPPTCENCGRDKQVTYICDACCSKLNAATRKLRAERDELQRRLDAVVKMFDVAYLASNSESASKAILALYKECRAIAEGREG